MSNSKNVSGDHRRCSKCGEWKAFGDFHKNQHRCKVCTKAYKNAARAKEISKRHYDANKDEISAHRKKVTRPAWSKSIEGRAYLLYFSALKRAKSKNREFTITRKHVETMLSFGSCWQTGFKFDLSRPNGLNRNPFAPSLDRRDNSKGYTPENVQIVSNIFNTGKNEHDELDFIAMCLAVAARNKNNTKAIARMNELLNARL